jgi:predicted permease
MRLFRLLLRLWPSSLQRAYGDAMEEAFEQRVDAARRAGRTRYLRVLAREAASLLTVAVAEHCGSEARAARRRARRANTRKAGLMDVMAREIRQAARRLGRAPLFTTAAVSTLALAIAANVAIFTVVERVVLNPLPFPESDRVIRLYHRVPRVGSQAFDSMPPGLYLDYAERARSLAAVAAYQVSEVTVTGSGEPERIAAARVTQSLNSVLRVPPHIGRWFTAGEDAPGGPPVAILSHGMWERRFARDPAVIGQSVGVNGVATEIIGVMPAGFSFPNSRAALWIPQQLTRAAGFGLITHTAVARLRDEVTLDAARADMDALIADLPRSFPESTLALSLALDKDRMRSTAVSLKEATVGQVERAIWILFGAVGVVLLVACANVANLLIARSETRRREVAVRQALGAGRAGMMQFFFAESVLLSIAGAAAGVAVAWATVQLFVSAAPATLPRLDEIRLGAAPILLAMALALVTTVVFSVMPLMQSSPLVTMLHEQGRGAVRGGGRHWARQMLIAAQTALALVLLVASGLMFRSFQELRAVDPGFNPSPAVTFRVGLPNRRYPDRETAVRTIQTILDRFEELPEAAAVSAATCLPLDGRCWGNSIFQDDGRDRSRPPQTDQARPAVMFRAVAAGYFETMGIRALRGRTLSADEVKRGESNVVVNQRFADAYFANQDPIGQRIASSRPPSLPAPPWLTVVGVVANTPTAALAEALTDPQVYMPMSIAGGPGIPQGMLVGPDVSSMSFVVRSSQPLAAMMPSIRRALDRVDPELAIAEPRTLEGILDRASAQTAFTMALLAIAAGIGLVLGIVGIYGVTSYIVGQRTAEIGIRLALGAEPGSVAAMIVRQGGTMVVGGAVVGFIVALAASRIIESLLYGVSPRDPGVFAATLVLLVGVALLACWLPARRAARLSPVDALRSE